MYQASISSNQLYDNTPTGILMGAPVALTAWPRTRPSVPSIAMHRTVFSPRCCATSRTSLWPDGESKIELKIINNYDIPTTSKASRMRGNLSPSKWTYASDSIPLVPIIRLQQHLGKLASNWIEMMYTNNSFNLSQICRWFCFGCQHSG